MSLHHPLHRPCGKPEHFLKLGDEVDGFATERPKDMCLLAGVLEVMAAANVHSPGMQTKISRRLASALIDSATDQTKADSLIASDESTENNESDKGSMTIHIDELADALKREILCASRQGKMCRFTQ